ncbi:HEPN domain-containing protein [Mycobacterium paragordonae]|uniref:ApeA N-terminal domain 1-containing protein n=1 Tax=Mycobacterium paragordonae TaxID=1389713 RepID=UPI0012E197FF|nr:HEPN domain-containing protein [Mycobacterium paragordonae]
MDGTLGHFWTDINDVYRFDEANDGYVRLTDDMVFHIDTLRTRQYLAEFGSNIEPPLVSPPLVYAITGTAPAVFFDSAGVSRANVFGDGASTQNVRMRGVVTGVPLDNIVDGQFVRVEVSIPEVTRWSGLLGMIETFELGRGGRGNRWSARTRDFDPIEVEIRRGHKLVLTTTWSVEGPDDKRIVRSPLEIGSISKKPLPWHEHLRPLMAIQDLINLAYQGFVPAEQANVQFEYQDGLAPLRGPEMWNSRLMAVPMGVKKPSSMTEFPMFYLSQLKGAVGLRNWIRLDRKHPRATGPVTKRYRFRTGGAEVRLTEVAMGIEYWTAAHRRTAQWTRPRRRGEPLPAALGRYVGPSFTEFVGDLDIWSQKFWEAYNSLKHVPNYEYDIYEVATLANSGALLLQGALLNRVALNKQLMKALCDSHRNYNLRQMTQEVVNR